MESTGRAIWTAIIGAVAACALLSWWWRRKVERARQWPQAEATVESGAFDTIGGGENQGPISVIKFGFSYRVAGEYFAGHFSLLPSKSEGTESLLLTMIKRKLQVHYDPKHPEVWFIDQERIEGHGVVQPIAPQVDIR